MYSKLFLLFSISFIFFGCSKPKENNNYGVKNDSVEKYLKLAERYDIPTMNRDQYNKKALSFVGIENGDSTSLGYLFRILCVSLKTDNNHELKKNLLIYFKHSLKNKDTLNIARCYRIKGSFTKEKILVIVHFFIITNP